MNVTAACQGPRAAGVRFSDVFGLWIGGSGGPTSVVNGVGGPVTNVTDPASHPVGVASYSG